MYTKLFCAVASLVISSITIAQPCPGRIVDRFGAIIRGDTCKKEIALVFTGDEFADGGEVIVKALSAKNVRASFFLTGRFYRNSKFLSLIKKLKKAGHYLGVHSDQHLLYNDWQNRDSLLVTHSEFIDDLNRNYDALNAFGVRRKHAKYFIPPYEWYNSTIVEWASSARLTLVNFSPGTKSTADYTYPELGVRYKSSDEIYNSILELETKKGLNGFILLIHIGTDPRRTDKFYSRLEDLIHTFNRKGYSFVKIDKLLN